MKVSSKHENIADCRVRIKLEIDPVELQPIFAEQLKNAAKRVKMPGFRVGKVPEKIVLASHGEAIREEVLSQVVSSALKEVIAEKKIETYGRPYFEEGSYDKNASFEKPFKVSVLVARPPSCKMKQWKKQSIVLPTCKVTDDDVLAAVQERLRPFGKMEDATGKLLPLDIITIDLLFADEKLKELQLQDHVFYFDKGGVVTSPPYLQSLYTEIEKMQVGGEVEIKQKFPAFSEPEYQLLSKNKLEVTLKVKSAKRMILPKLDAEMLKKLGFESEIELRNELKDLLEKQVDEKLEKKKIRLALDSIKKNCSFEIPLEAKNYLISHYWNSYLTKYVPENQREKTQPPKAWLTQATVHAVAEIEDELLFAEIAKAEVSLNPKDDEVVEELEKMKVGISADTKLDEATKNKNMTDLQKDDVKPKVKELLMQRRIVEHVLDKTEVKQGKPVPMVDFFRD